MLSVPDVVVADRAMLPHVAPPRLIHRASYSLRSVCVHKTPSTFLIALIEGVKARVSNYLLALVSLAGACAASVNNSPSTSSILSVSMLWRRNLRGAAINFSPRSSGNSLRSLGIVTLKLSQSEST